MKNAIFVVNLTMCLWETLWTFVTLLLFTVVLEPMNVITVELLTTSRMNFTGYCVILRKGKKECKCFHSCSRNENLHYDLM